MRPGERALAAARRAIGARFRLHGREAASGLDCVGLAALTLRAEGFAGAVPSGYRLRSGDEAAVMREIAAAGLAPCPIAPGRLVLMRAGAGQLHLAIATERGIIHADAMLGRVAERPDLPWPVLGCWRPSGGE